MTSQQKNSKYFQEKPKERIPKWLIRPIGNASELEKVQNLVKRLELHTICEEGRCPNRGECYASGTATFLLGGPICTRSCSFCQVDKGLAPADVDLQEPERVAKAIRQLKLNYVVLTSVARDDLSDHGASLFTSTMNAIRVQNPNIDIEVLTPDFWGGFNKESLCLEAQQKRVAQVLDSKPVCFNHNLETVARLQPEVRRGATYAHSLQVLKFAKEISPNIPTKSGIMLGLGEEPNEIIQTLKDLRKVGCEQVTLGQYLRPSLNHIPVKRYWEPKEFDQLAKKATEFGFSKVNSGPLVRSSYHAK